MSAKHRLGSAARDRRGQPRHRRVSRRVRLRRTMAAVLATGLLVLGIAAIWQIGSPGRQPQQASAPGEGGSRTPTAAGSASGSPMPTLTTGDVASARETAGSSRAGSDQAVGRKKVPAHGTGKLVPVEVPGKDSTGAGRVVRYSLEIEQGMGTDAHAVATKVFAVLHDRRGWQTQDHVRFQHVTPKEEAQGAKIDIRITLASPTLTDKLCAPAKTGSTLSCFNRGRAVLNDARWQNGAKSYGTDVAAYRIYQVNHEVGHGLGHEHAKCPAHGTAAPVMVQQTIGREGCTAWPYPTRP